MAFCLSVLGILGGCIIAWRRHINFERRAACGKVTRKITRTHELRREMLQRASALSIASLFEDALSHTLGDMGSLNLVIAVAVGLSCVLGPVAVYLGYLKGKVDREIHAHEMFDAAEAKMAVAEATLEGVDGDADLEEPHDSPGMIPQQRILQKNRLLDIYQKTQLPSPVPPTPATDNTDCRLTRTAT